MGDEDHPLIGLRGGDDLPLGRKPVGDFFRQIPGLPKLKLRHFGSSIMSGPSPQGRWVASSVTEEDIAKLREARYLTVETPHRLPAQVQVIPTPTSGERVVFISHFLRGLGFALHPFVRGLMFYYGLDFHDLAPDSFLHISAFIITCDLPPNSHTLWLMAQDL